MKPSICIVTCYRQPDYVRAAALRQGLRASGVFREVIVVKNRRTNAGRYLEVIMALLKVRLRQNPDAYMLTFRGYEMLPIVLLLGLGKKVVYDELINPVEWFVYEHRWFREGSLAARLLRAMYGWLGRRTSAIIADTPSHAAYSAELLGLPQGKYWTIPVSTDETLFNKLTHQPHDGFRVLYYGSMLPLHGVDYVIEAALELADRPDITFHIIGGKAALAGRVQRAIERGARITYDSWIPYEQLPVVMAGSDLCLGGPFGDTVQAQFVVTGKTYQFLAAGLPVVVGANRESDGFIDKQTALVVPLADTRALVGAIRWAEAHPQELRHMAANGRELYEAQYSSARVAEELRRLFADHVFQVQAGRDDE